MSIHRQSNKRKDGTQGFMAAFWLLVVALLPFFIYPAHLLSSTRAGGGDVSAAMQSLSATTASVTPEMAWIFPRVLLVLLFAVPGLLWVRRRFAPDLYSLLVTVYALAFLLSAVLSHDQLQFILLGSSGRMDGVLYAVGLTVFMLSGYYLSKDYPDMLQLFYLAVSIGGVAETAVVTLQRLGHDPIGPITRGQPYTDIITGTVGNPGMLAGLLLPVTLLSLGVALTPRFSTRMRNWAVAAMLITAAGIAMTGNKSSFYGLILMLVLYVLLERSRPAFLLSVAAVASLLVTPHIVPNRTSYSHPLTLTSSAATRPALWLLTLKAVAATPGQPLWGAGPDGLRLTVLRHEKLLTEMMDVYRVAERWPAERRIERIEPLYSAKDPIRSRAFVVIFSDNPSGQIYRVNVDKAHNMLLDRAVRSGVLAALIWAILYLVPVFRIIGSRNPLLKAAAVSLAGLFLYYLFWFPVPQVEPIHVALVSIAWGISGRRS